MYKLIIITYLLNATEGGAHSSIHEMNFRTLEMCEAARTKFLARESIGGETWRKDVMTIDNRTYCIKMSD